MSNIRSQSHIGMNLPFRSAQCSIQTVETVDRISSEYGGILIESFCAGLKPMPLSSV